MYLYLLISGTASFLKEIIFSSPVYWMITKGIFMCRTNTILTVGVFVSCFLCYFFYFNSMNVLTTLRIFPEILKDIPETCDLFCGDSDPCNSLGHTVRNFLHITPVITRPSSSHKVLAFPVNRHNWYV